MAKDIIIKSDDIPALEARTRSLLDQIKPEYRAWLAETDTAVYIRQLQKGGWLGSYAKQMEFVFLSPKIFDEPINVQRTVLQEETVHMIDHKLDFTISKAFEQSNRDDVEELSTKTALALSRIWSGLLKDMPTGAYYKGRGEQSVVTEMLPDILLVQDMLRQAPEDESDRKQHFIERIEQTYRSEMDPEKAAALMFIETIRMVFDDEQRMQEETGEALITFVDEITQKQPQQLKQVQDTFVRLVSNPEHETPKQLMRAALPNLAEHAEDFSRITKNTGALFTGHPGWKDAIYSHDVTGIRALLDAGTTVDAINFMLNQKPHTAVKQVLHATKKLFLDAGYAQELPDTAAHLSAKIDGATLAGLMRDQINARGKGKQ